mmetsp:Transcript_3192/g.6460  ORF Transcript_3192/g.6460 Transcript_3192/m.6460 type:complete len:763 (+) Transcript_3192:38-2326(+)|eukprot:CAMPEP_0118646422 /NCGR_PEP_ID=MMETSP0785-20121206/8045_1 /TAXON_ID=91992 /ORGANISM="Bolidomonas pacifica, Strain CCMP 1866" /LENGTH=762 /DNA_ID=CAMNT_0006538409 /DNA_START=26 /DNA_END=2314 /DNA_ORIENTATION=+
MAMSLSSGGGAAGGGLSTAAMAYQAPTTHSMPSAQTNSTVNLMRSSVATTEGQKTGKMTPEDLERMVAPIISLSFHSPSTTYYSYSAPPSNSPVNIVSPPQPYKGSLRLKGSDERSFKALRKFDKKGYDIRGCFEKSVVLDTSPSTPQTITIGGYHEIVNLREDKNNVKYGKDGTVSITLSPEWEPITLKTRTLLSLYIHLCTTTVLPPSLSAHSPIVSISTTRTMGDLQRSVIQSSLNATDSLPSSSQGVMNIKKKEREGREVVYSLTPRIIGAVAGTMHLSGAGGMRDGESFMDGVNTFIMKAIRRTGRKYGTQEQNKVPPCIRESEVPIWVVVMSEGGGYEVAGVKCEELQSMGKNKKGKPIPGFASVKVISRSFAPSSSSLGKAVNEVWNRIKRIHENRGIVGFLHDVEGWNAQGDVKECVGVEVFEEMGEMGEKPLVTRIDDKAVTAGMCIIANSGGEGRIKIGRTGNMMIADVVGREVGIRVECKGKTEVKRILEVGRYMPAKHEVDFTAVFTACWYNGGDEVEYGKADDDATKAYEGRKNIKEKRELARELNVEVVQRGSGDDEWEALPLVEEDGRLDYRPFKPLVIGGEDDPTVCPNATLTLGMDSGGIISTRLIRSNLEIEEDVKMVEGDRRMWWWVGGICAFIALAISWRSYHVTYVFDRNVLKLHTFYKFVNKTINPLNEAKYIVYEYNDNIEVLWEKLERKYGIPVEEPTAYFDIIEERERIKELEREEEERKEKEEEERKAKEGDREEL